MGKQKIRPALAGELTAICKALADTTNGLTGSQISNILSQAGVPDSDPTLTKWQRLFNALALAQNTAQHAAPVLDFIHHALEPARWAGERGRFEEIRARVNVPLAFLGLQFHQDGRFRAVQAATTLSEAEERANRLRVILQARGVHADVVAFCRAELLADNYFHAVQEAAKSVAEKIRLRSQLTSDGSKLADAAFSGDDPLLRINSLANESERSEQSGFLNLVKGLFGVFRNPTTHAPRLLWTMPEEDALDLFSLASYAHRRIDRASKRT